MVKQMVEGSVRPVVANSPRAVVIELEAVAVDGRRMLYEAMKEAIGDKEIDLSPYVFSRLCLDCSHRDSVSAVFEASGKKYRAEDRVVERMLQGVREMLAKPVPQIRPDARQLLLSAAAQGRSLGALSYLGKTEAAALAGNLGLDELGVHVLSYPCDDKPFPSVDGWLTLAREVGVTATGCVAVTTSSIACRSALAAHMWAVVVPDDFTAFQDFGGADFVADTLDEEAIQRTLALLELPR
ncbi:hypothetical protein ACFLSJ_07515 [Verrucomicrobiota bacterium]